LIAGNFRFLQAQSLEIEDVKKRQVPKVAFA